MNVEARERPPATPMATHLNSRITCRGSGQKLAKPCGLSGFPDFRSFSGKTATFDNILAGTVYF
jgi:hypothetical protein